MGKAQKRTFKSRANPLGAATVPGAVTAVQSTDEVPALLKKLAASDANDRAWAAASASNLLLSDDGAVRRMLLSNNVIGALVERLSDSVPDVVVQASGALYALAAADHGAAVEIARRNVYAAVQTLLPRLASAIDGVIKGEEQRDGACKTVLLTADNAISLLRVLCETVPASLDQINDMALIPFLVSFFKVADRLPATLVQTAGQFLHTLTDENAAAKRALLDHSDAVDVLCGVVRATQLGAASADDTAIVRMLAGAVLMNIKDMAIERLEDMDDAPVEEARIWEDMTRAVLQVVAGFIAFDSHETAARALQLATAPPPTDIVTGPEPSAQEAELNRLGARLDYVQMALELAANIFTDEGATDADAAAIDETVQTADEDAGSDASDDEMAGAGSDDEDVDSDGDSDKEADQDKDTDFDENDMNEILGNETVAAREAEAAVQQSVLGLFIDTILPPLLHLAEPTAAALATAGNDDDARIASVAADFAALHERALACFNNFLLVVEESLRPWFTAHGDSVAKWWHVLVAVAERVLSAGPPAGAILDPVIGCMWTLARGVGGAVPATPEHIEGLMHVARTAATPGLRSKAVGVLGTVARRQPGFVDTNRRIGLFLVDDVVGASLHAFVQGERVAVEPVAEALDLLFDVYGDAAYDYDAPVFVGEALLPRLRQMYAPMRRLAKSVDRRTRRRLRDRCDLAAQNLRAFIEYKAAERRGA
ncbi:hypothetical protein H4S01_001740 [Coemansia sp. RSA 2610]|nr:hypothetical protein H4S01_001740 [Coemansia sp. RSA 2610]